MDSVGVDRPKGPVIILCTINQLARTHPLGAQAIGDDTTGLRKDNNILNVWLCLLHADEDDRSPDVEESIGTLSIKVKHNRPLAHTHANNRLP